jgi:HSP20 family protein
MSIMKRNGNGFSSLPGLFDDLFTKDLWDWGLTNQSSTGTTLPAVNIRETADDFIVEMAAPGMKKEDFKVQLDGNMLAISSEKKQEHEEKDGERYTRKEFSYESFTRSFQLPKEVVDEEHIRASYRDGVLQLMIPKKEGAKQKPPRMIEIA